eukprot:NODE_1084_length_1019_cov_110.409193_g1039_i0.p1 GENE.NODE_1084_length_1019_cov_110.409193_g1039_i0~~NODE_1084_length_1019_cov_110.409193_g1039_i0.p1  ORF type:complete len:281 (+),score=54.24 NODE_1084_length_1019_cov_110.409193_g1039_i0:70-912(+)
MAEADTEVTPDPKQEHKEKLEALKKEASKWHSWISSECDSDQELLWQVFTEFDRSLDGSIDAMELDAMLKSFDPGATDEEIGQYKEKLDSDGDHQISFIEFVKWWEDMKGGPDSARAGGAGLSTMLTARFFAKKTAQFTVGFVTTSPWEKMLGSASLPTLQDCVKGLRGTYFAVRQYKYEKKLAGLIEEEKRRQEKVIEWTADEELLLSTIFDRFSHKKGTEGTVTVGDLPQLTNLVRKVQLSGMVISMTKTVYGEELDFEKFLQWWACRPESKKIGRFW